MNEALVLRNLNFGYGSRAAVQNVSLHVRPGDCYGFLGHNGAGKTTVMRLCIGLLRPSSGDAHVFGIDVRKDRRRANALLGALIERPGFHDHVSARRNLRALARLQGIAGRIAGIEAERVLELVGLAANADQRVGTFSLGMRQRLGIAQALLGKPRLLLLDEPTNGLDPEGIAELRALLMRLTADERTAVMLSSHQLAELEGLCNRIGVLREGQMVAEGSLDSLRRRIGTRHVVTGSPIATLQTQLEHLALAPTREGDRLFVELGDRPPADVVRALSQTADLTSFAPEPASLERIYLEAGRGGLAAAPSEAVEPPAADDIDVTPRLSGSSRPRWRTFAFEATCLLQKRSTLPLFAVPCAASAWAISDYRARVADGMAAVEAGERFSADAGSGYLAVAHGLQAGVPVLALVLIWFGSQIIAGDLAGDTLRNTLTRGVRRHDVLFGKLSVLLVAALAGWLAMLATNLITGATLVGFGDLEEVTRFGDREVLADAATVGPTLWVTAAQMLLPLAAIASLAALASSIARRPALALAAAALFVGLPELARGLLGERAGWLLTSHFPTLWRDDSAVGYFGDIARGAADALWVFADHAAVAPLAWFAAATVTLALLFSRLRIS